MKKKLDKTIKTIRLKDNQILEIRPPKDSSIYYRFEVQRPDRIVKFIVWNEKSGFDN